MNKMTPDYRLKVERAKRHIEELTQEIQAFHARRPYTIFAENDAHSDQRVWKVKVNERIPQKWSAIVGDAIHNVRASLDVLLCAVVRASGREHVNHVHFVIRETEKEFEAALPKNIRGASPAAVALIRELKPYKGGNEALWRLHRLDILDKHQGIVPVGASYRSVDILPIARAEFAGLVKQTRDLAPTHQLLSQLSPLFLNVADRLYPLRDGAELFRAPLSGPLPPDHEMQFRFEVAFGEDQILDGEPVIPALHQLIKFTEGTFGTFEARILN